MIMLAAALALEAAPLHVAPPVPLPPSPHHNIHPSALTKVCGQNALLSYPWESPLMHHHHSSIILILMPMFILVLMLVLVLVLVPYL